MNFKQSRHTRDESPLSPECGCPVCAKYSRAYLRHLFKAKETLAGRLLTQHNLHFYGELTRKAREHIEAGDYDAWASAAIARMREEDEVTTNRG